MEHWRLVVAIVLVCAIAGAIEGSIGWVRLFEPWARMEPTVLALALLLTFFAYLVRALRNYDYFLPETRDGFVACLKLTLLHNILNNLLPMRSGETSFPILLKGYFSIPVARSIAALLWFRVMDMHALLFVALLTIGSRWMGWPTLGVLGALWMLLPVGLFRLQSSSVLGQVLTKLPQKWRDRFEEAARGLPQSRSTFIRAWIWTVINWFVKLTVFAWILLMFAPMPFAAAIAGSIGGDLTSVLPIHGIAGIGTYEGGVVAAVAPFGIPLEQALSGAVNLHLFLLGTSAVAGVFALLLQNSRGVRGMVPPASSGKESNRSF